MTGLIHDESGFPTSKNSEVINRMNLLRNKITSHCQEIWKMIEYYTDDAEHLIIAYGSAARSARGAVESLRNRDIKAGLIDLKTIWPFPDLLIKRITEKINLKTVFVAENSMGQLIHPIQEIFGHPVNVFGINRYDGHALDPYEIIDQVKENIYA